MAMVADLRSGTSGARRWRGITWAMTLVLALALSGCGGGSDAHSKPHATLDSALASQSVYVTILLGQTYQNPGVTVALNAQTGDLRWKADTSGPGAAPAVAGGAVFVAPEDTTIRALDAATGKPRWTYTRATGVSAQWGFDGYAVVTGDTLYVTSDSGAVFALDPTTGKLRWQRTWPHQGDTIYAAPAVDSGMVFVGVGGQDGGAYALNAQTGAIVWQTAHLEGFDARPVVADGMVFFSGQTPGTLVALDERTGAERWQRGSSPTSSAPVVGGGLVYTAGADEIIRAYRVQDGSSVWTFQTGGSAGNALIATGAAMTLVNGTLYAGSQGGVLYALDATTGKQRWAVAVNSPIDSSPAVASGAVFANTENGQILAYRASDGAPAWSYYAGASALIPSGPVIASASGQ